MKAMQFLFKRKNKDTITSFFQNSQIFDWFFILLFLGFILRLWLSNIPGAGDININKGWAESGVRFGIVESYEKQVNNNMLPNYPPLGISIFTWTGHLYKAIISPNFNSNNPLFNNYIKLPGIIADILAASLLFFCIKKWQGIKKAFWGMAIILLNPAILYNSTIWGQVDAIYSLFLIGALFAFIYRHHSLSASLFALALLSKLQAIILLPLFFFLFTSHGKKACIKGTIASTVTVVMLLLPFLIKGKIQTIFNVYFKSVGFYPTVSVNAYNFWWAILGEKASQIQDTAIIFNLLSYRTTGIILYIMTSIITLWIFRKTLTKEDNTLKKILAYSGIASIMAYAFFLFATEMHERYLFPLMFLAIPIAVENKKIFALYAISSVLFLLTMMSYLPFGIVDTFLYTKIEHLEIIIAICQLWTFSLFFKEVYSIVQKK